MFSFGTQVNITGNPHSFELACERQIDLKSQTSPMFVQYSRHHTHDREFHVKNVIKRIFLIFYHFNFSSCAKLSEPHTDWSISHF